MRRFLLSVALFVLGPARAGAIASPANSTVPAHAVLVGRSGSQADTESGAFTIVVRDAANVPIPGEVVEFRVLLCPGAQIAEDQLQPGVTARCATNGVRAVTGPDGSVRFAVVGGGIASAPHGTGPCAQVFAGPASLGTVRLAYLDLDGSGGVTGNDLSVWLTDFATGEPIARSDYDGDGLVGADDLSLWLTVWLAGRSRESVPSYCPVLGAAH